VAQLLLELPISTDAQINALNDRNSAVRGAIGSLAATAGTYQDKISQLQSQISSVEAVLSQSLARQATLQQQITETQAKINLQKQYLAENIKMMYVDGQLTTIEALATSRNLSDYVDKETYRTTVQNKSMMNQLNRFNSSKHSFKSKGELMDSLLLNSSNKPYWRASAMNNSRCFSYNQAQQAGYNREILTNNAQIARLRQQQNRCQQSFR
jgi:chromosome segregation ATPase